MTEREIQQYAKKFFQHNADKLDDFSMRLFMLINHDKDKRSMMDEDGYWKYKEITERAKAFEEWNKFIVNKQKLKNIEKNPATTNSFLERTLE